MLKLFILQTGILTIIFWIMLKGDSTVRDDFFMSVMQSSAILFTGSILWFSKLTIKEKEQSNPEFTKRKGIKILFGVAILLIFGFMTWIIIFLSTIKYFYLIIIIALAVHLMSKLIIFLKQKYF